MCIDALSVSMLHSAEAAEVAQDDAAVSPVTAANRTSACVYGVEASTAAAASPRTAVCKLFPRRLSVR